MPENLLHKKGWLSRLKYWAGLENPLNVESPISQQRLFVGWVAVCCVFMGLIWAVFWYLASPSSPNLSLICIGLTIDCLLVLRYKALGRMSLQKTQWALYFSMLFTTWAIADSLPSETGVFLLPTTVAFWSVLIGRTDRPWIMTFQVGLSLVAGLTTYHFHSLVLPQVEIVEPYTSTLYPLFLSTIVFSGVVILIFERYSHDQVTIKLRNVAIERLDDFNTLRHTKAELRVSSNRLKALLDGTPAIMLLLDIEGNILEYNVMQAQYAQRITGNEVVKGKNIFSYEGTDTQWFRTALGKAIEGEASLIHEDYTDLAGRVVALEIHFSPARDAEGKIFGAVLTTLDVSERQEYLNLRLQAETHLQALMENLTDMVWSIDREYNILTFNPSFNSFLIGLGLPALELGKKNVDACTEAVTAYYKNIYDCTFEGESVRIEREAFWKGEQIFLEIRTSPIVSPSGAIVGASVIASVITDRKAAEAELIAAKEQAEEASLVKSRFLAHISHELRNPIQAIHGCIHMLGEGDITARQEPVLAMLNKSSRRMLSSLDNLLDYSLLETGRFELRQAAFDLQQSVSDSLALYEHLAQNRSLTFKSECHWADTNRWVIGDAPRLFRVIDNLVDNALKLTPSGGKVSIDIYQVLLADEQVQTRFNVCDEGPGMPEELVASIYEPFKQIDGSSTKEVQGLGLGLSVACNLLELMGSHLEVGCNLDGGSCFAFTITTPTLTVLKAKQELYREKARKHKDVRILVAEDDEANALYLQHLFQNVGWQVSVASNGIQALKYLQKASFDTVIMDGAMPIMDGMEATRQIRQAEEIDPDRDRMPIIVVSGFARGTERDQFLALDIDAFLTKPIVEAELISVVLNVLPLIIEDDLIGLG